MQKKLTTFLHEGKNYLVVDNEAFDWDIDPDQLKNLEISIKADPEMRESYIANIFEHLVSCFSEFVGKKISLKEINDSLERGYIDIP
jgi:hypothetical protein